MKIYSDGKSRSLNGAFPRRFRLMNAGKEVPFIRTGRESIRISGELPIGELDIQELVLPKKEPEIKAEKLAVGNVAIVNKADVERLDVMTQTLDKNAGRIEEQMNFIAGQEKVLSDLETQNAESIELLSGQTASAVQMLKGAIDDAEKKNNAVQKALNKAISETSEDLSDSLVAHETANNPHRITKATIGLDKVENISPEEMPMTKEVKNAIDKKADKEAIKDLKKRIDEAAKSQKNVEKGLERLNWVGGVGGNEIPSGGKRGQLLGKASNKTGDYTWVDAKSGIEIKRVDVLPDTGDSGTLYLVPSSDPQTSNIYDEYIWADNGHGTYAWEKIGSTEIDLSGYVKSVNNNTPDSNGNVSLTIPTVNDATITIQKNSTTIDSFTTNDATAKTINITVPTDTNDLTNGAGYITSSDIPVTDVTVNGTSVLNNGVAEIPNIPTSSDYWTVGTQGVSNYQTTYSKKTIFYNAVGAQDNGLKVLSSSDTSPATSTGAWSGRCLFGNEKRTFLLGTARNSASSSQSICGIGAHTWGSASTQTSAAWDNVYIQPDGTTAVYLGGNGWRGNSGWFRVQNSGSSSASYKAQINTGTSVSLAWKNILPNQSTGTSAILFTTTIASTNSHSYSTSVNGTSSGQGCSSFGYGSNAANYATALGYNAQAVSANSIQIGQGTNNTANTMYVGLSSSLNVQLLDSTGKVPDDRLNTTIARTSQIPTVNNSTITITQGGVTKGSFTLNQATGDTIALDAGGGGGSYSAGTGIDITGSTISVTSPTLTNTATGTNSLDLLGYAATTGTQSISIGYHSSTNASNYSTAVGTGSSCTTSATQSCAFGSSSYAVGSNSTAVGYSARTDNTYSIAVGSGSRSSGDYSIQLGYGINSEANSFYVATSSSNNWKLLGNDGLIPSGRIPISTSVSSSSDNTTVVGAKLFYDTCGDIETLINAL